MRNQTTQRGDQYIYMQLLKSLQGLLPSNLLNVLGQASLNVTPDMTRFLSDQIEQNRDLLQNSRPDRSVEELVTSTCSAYLSYLLSFARLGRCGAEAVRRRISEVERNSTYISKNSERRPILAVSMHYGFYELAAVWLRQHVDSMVVPVRSSVDERQNAYRERVRDRWNVRTVYLDQYTGDAGAMSRLRRLLGPDRAVGIPGDIPGRQLGGTDSKDPLGLEEMFYEASVIGLRTHCVLLPILVRDVTPPFRITVYEPIQPQRRPGKQLQQQIRTVRRELWKRFRPDLRRNPDFWFRFHGTGTDGGEGKS